ncbi:MAG: hypothetical protein LKI80_13290 [Sporolactobacillus sp.]|jgi:glucose-6-phosphate isomerase|nr:hypothetical protein [Sporolactobacillus sp.]
MDYHFGFDVSIDYHRLTFAYGKDTFGPRPEYRHLRDIRQSLLDSHAQGPEILYSIAMDVGRIKDYDDLTKRMLLYGIVIFNKGRIGVEPVRSQGHIHAVSCSVHSSTPEVYEVWDGQAIIYMQEFTQNNPGHCYAVYAEKGDIVVVPPAWAHCTINADSDHHLIFGAWCVRDYAFDYRAIRAHKGLAFYPIVNQSGQITWRHNDHYQQADLQEKKPRDYTDLRLTNSLSIYEQYIQNHDCFNFITRPGYNYLWENYRP